MQLQNGTPVSCLLRFPFRPDVNGPHLLPLQRACVGPSQLSPLNTTNSYSRNPWAKSAQQIPRFGPLAEQPLRHFVGLLPPCRLVQHAQRHAGHRSPMAGRRRRRGHPRQARSPPLPSPGEPSPLPSPGEPSPLESNALRSARVPCPNPRSMPLFVSLGRCGDRLKQPAGRD